MAGRAASEAAIALAEADDALAILKLQFLCFQDEATLYQDHGIRPLTQDLESMRADIDEKTVLVARLDGELIGSVRGRRINDTCEVGRLMVHPRFTRQGLGERLMAELAGRSVGVARFELFTGGRSAGNLRLYERLGYREFRRETITDVLDMCYLERWATADEH